MVAGLCSMTESQVQEAFLAAPPLISQQILDLTVKNPNWLRDVFQTEEWPRGNGTIIKQLISRGEMPQIERGFSLWAKQTNDTGCDPCEGPNCGYNWTDFGGTGLEEKETQLMSRDFRSPSYCIKKIQTTANFKEVFANIVQNLYAQIDFFKEMNIGLNALTSLAKKYVVDGGGAKPNIANPYVYPAVGAVTLSALNLTMLEFFYEYMRRIPDAVPYDIINGAPVFSLICSSQLLAHLYRDDPQLRQDVRFSGLATDLVTKYNFVSTIRGMFIAAPVLYPRRFNLDANGVPVEVLPFVKGIPMQVGTFTGFNPLYQAAIYEEVIIHGKYPFKIFTMPTEETLGANTSFGPEFSLFNSWLWINPLTTPDPFRRVGYFATSASIGISQQFSDGIFGILVERPSVLTMAMYNPAGECPPVDPECNNEIAGTGCPCPLILTYFANPTVDGDFFLTLAVPLPEGTTEHDEIQFGIDTGGYVTGTVVSISEDLKAVEVTFDNDPGTCDHFTTVFCDNTLGCSSSVMSYSIDPADATRLYLTLQYPIKALTGSITMYTGDGNSQTVTVVDANMVTNLWHVDVGGSAFSDTVGGVIAVCVPTATDATCPGCTDPTVTQCAT